MKDKTVSAELRHPFIIIADGSKKNREKEVMGEPILAQSENWLGRRDGKK